MAEELGTGVGWRRLSRGRRAALQGRVTLLKGLWGTGVADQG